MESRHVVWILPAVSIGSILIFAATYFAYFNARTEYFVGGYVPLIVGALSSAALVGAGSFVLSRNSSIRLWHCILAAVAAGLAFVFAMLFVLVNTLGA